METQKQDNARPRRWAVVVAHNHEWKLLPGTYETWHGAQLCADVAQNIHDGAALVAEVVVAAGPGEQSGAPDNSRGKQFDAAHGWPSLRWSAELPKRRGWWWVRVPGMPARPIEVENWHGSLNAFDGHEWRELNNTGNYWKGAEWAGPLVKPLEASDEQTTANQKLTGESPV